MRVITELQCWGSIPYWVALCKAESIVFEKQERFQKSGNRNRYKILSATGPLLLSVPVAGGRENKSLIHEVEIDADQSWQKKHQRALSSCYNKSPFYFYYADEIEALYENAGNRLWDWNLNLYKWMASKIGFAEKEIHFSTTYEPLVSPDFNDIRGAHKSDSTCFEEYIQVFGTYFTQGLSILDVLFNLGNETFHYLHRQREFRDNYWS